MFAPICQRKQIWHLFPCMAIIKATFTKHAKFLLKSDCLYTTEFLYPLWSNKGYFSILFKWWDCNQTSVLIYKVTRVRRRTLTSQSSALFTKAIMDAVIYASSLLNDGRWQCYKIVTRWRKLIKSSVSWSIDSKCWDCEVILFILNHFFLIFFSHCLHPIRLLLV